MLISVQCSRGVVVVFFFAHCTLTAGLVNLTTSRNTLVDELAHAFLGRQLLVVAPINLANTNIVMRERYQTATLFLSWNSFNIAPLEYERNRCITARHERQTVIRENKHVGLSFPYVHWHTDRVTLVTSIRHTPAMRWTEQWRKYRWRTSAITKHKSGRNSCVVHVW